MKGSQSCSFERRRLKWRKTVMVFFWFFFANIWFKVAYFWQLFSLSAGGRKFSAAWLFSCCQSTGSYGSTIISECTSRARSTQCKVVYVVIWIFLAVFLQPVDTEDQICILHLFHLVSDALSAWRHGKIAAWKGSLPLAFFAYSRQTVYKVRLIVYSARFIRFKVSFPPLKSRGRFV